MFCTKCGYELSTNSKFCTNCGEKVKFTVEYDNHEINTVPVISVDLKDFNYFENSVSEALDIDELRSCFLEFLNNECNKCRLINSENHIEVMGNIKLNTNTMQYLYSIPKFLLWNNASSKMISNVYKYFSPNEQYGEILGFIDGGNVLKRGSSGLLFCANGIAVRGLMDETTGFLSLARRSI